MRVPRNLAILSWLHASLPLLLGLHVAIASRAEWWRLPWRGIGIAACVGLVFALLFIVGTRRQRLWLPVSLRVFLVAWMGVAVWVAIRELSTALAVFAVFLMGFSLLLLQLVERERGRSYLDPRMRWFEGRPRLIPGLRAVVSSLEQREGKGGAETAMVWKASRLDREGVFLFVEGGNPSQLPDFVLCEAKVRVELSFRDRVQVCFGEPVAALLSRAGLGVRLRPGAVDEATGLGQLVEAIGGEGYA